MSFLTLLMSLFCVTTLSSDHPFHVSHTEIRYNEVSHTFEVTSRMFTDDLELAVSEWSETNYTYSIEDTNSDSLLEHYFQTHFAIQKKNGKEVNLNYLGSELSKDMGSVWVYHESDTLVPSPSEFIIENSLIMGAYDDQKNILSLECLEDQYYLLYQHPDQKESVHLHFNTGEND